MHQGWQLCVSTVNLAILDALTSVNDHQLVTDTHFLFAVTESDWTHWSNFYLKVFEYDGI